MSVSTLRPWEDLARSPKGAAPRSNIASAIDELGQLREQLKAMEAREKSLVEIVKEMGEGEHNGDKCKAIVSVSKTSRLDTTALKETLPDEMITKFTKSSDVVKVSIKPIF